MMESKAATPIKAGTVSLHENVISDHQPSLKIALGSQIYPRCRSRLMGTNIRPEFTLMHTRATELFTNAWFLTPVGFIGIEWPDETNNDALDVTLFCGRTIIHKSYSLIDGRISLSHVTRCGASLNFRFGLS